MKKDKFLIAQRNCRIIAQRNRRIIAQRNCRIIAHYAQQKA